MAIPLHRRVVPVTYVQLLHDYLELQGIDPPTLLGEPWPRPDPTGVEGIDVSHWASLLAHAASKLRDPYLSLHLGATITVRHLGVLGIVLQACNSLAAALDTFDRYQRLIFDVTPMIRKVDQSGVNLIWDNRTFQPDRLVEETGFAVLIQFCRSLVRGPLNPSCVAFVHEAPTDTTPYELFFGCEVLFGQPEPLIRLDSALLDRPLKSPDPLLMNVLQQHADRLISGLPQQEAVVETVRRVIADMLRQGEPDIDRVSRHLGVSSRTLQKRLQIAGTAFRDETRFVRHQLADVYLRDMQLQIVDIALLLGYSEHSAFSRAYREWTGKTPLQVRSELMPDTSM